MAGSGAMRLYLSPPPAYVGRHRVFAILRPQFSNTPVYLRAFDRYGTPLGPTAVATGFTVTD